MPYYPDNQDRDYCTQLVKKNVCSECSGSLSLRYDFDNHRIMVVCNTNLRHDGIAREYKQPLQLEEMNIPTRREYMSEQIGRKVSTTALEKIPTKGQLTQPQAEHILSLVYPGCPRDEIIRCAILCRDFGLHPLMKEVYLIPFKEKNGKENYVTILGINATRKLMAQRGSYSYIDDTPRRMTEEEQMRIFGEVDDKNIVAITKLKTKDGLEAPGYGKWPIDKSPYGADKGNTKANMAFIRSERNAFGRLSPDAIPQDVEIIDEAYVKVPDVDKVIQSTGEIIEAEVVKTPEAEDLLTPPEEEKQLEKDETPINDDQVQTLVKLMNETDMSYGDLAKFCNKEKGWNIRDFKTELKVWQYDIILKAFKKGE